MARKYTILLIPEGTRTVKRFSAPLWIFPLFLALLAVSIGAAFYWYQQYDELRLGYPDVTSLEEKNQRHEAWLAAYQHRLNEFKKQMTELRAFDRRLRQLANLERADEPRIQLEGGSNGAGIGGPGLRLSQSPKERQKRVMLQDLDKLKLAGEVEAEVQDALIRFLKDRHSILAQTPSIWPTRGRGAEKSRWITSGYGRRRSPFTGKVQFHAGIDIAAPIGTPIVAPADGVVTFTGSRSGYGRLLEVDHGNGLVTLYGHLHRIKVKEGQKIKRWDVVASVGNSGRSKGSHLHYEVHMGGVPTNPKYYILD